MIDFVFGRVFGEVFLVRPISDDDRDARQDDKKERGKDEVDQSGRSHNGRDEFQAAQDVARIGYQGDDRKPADNDDEEDAQDRQDDAGDGVRRGVYLSDGAENTAFAFLKREEKRLRRGHYNAKTRGRQEG